MMLAISHYTCYSWNMKLSTLDDLWARCKRDRYGRGTKTDREAERLYERHLEIPLGSRPVSKLGYPDVSQVHHRLKATPFQANRVVSLLSALLSDAERYGWRPINSNPCGRLRRFKEPSRRRYATPEEMKAIAGVLWRYTEDKTHRPAAAFVLLMMYSGARPSEILNASPGMVERNGEAGVLRLEHGKTGRRDVFLPPQAMRVLDGLPAKRDRLVGLRSVPQAFWEKVRTEAGCPDLWVRDLRRTFATVALSNGMPIGTVSELLGHADVRTTKIYAKLMEAPAHAAAASVAGRIDEMVGKT